MRCSSLRRVPALALAWISTAILAPQARAFELIGAAWVSAQPGIRINPNFPDESRSGSPQEQIDILRCAAEAWRSQTRAEFRFIYQGTTSLTGFRADGTARLWDVATGTELRRYNRKPFSVHSVAFAPDGRTVLVATNDGLAYRYDVDYRETARYLCTRLQRDFSPEEQTQYDLDGAVNTCANWHSP